MNRILSLCLLPLVAFACGGFENATKDRPNGTQRQAIGGVFKQAGTTADVIIDPMQMNGEDLGTMLGFGPFILVSDPSRESSMTGDMTFAGIPNLSECHQQTGPDSYVLNQCIVMTNDGKECSLSASANSTNVSGPSDFNDASGGPFLFGDGSVAQSDGGPSNDAATPCTGSSCDEGSGVRYTGNFDLSGEGCPNISLTVNFYMDGPTDSPEVVSGVCAFGANDAAGNIYTGQLIVNEVAIVDPCTNPSTGTFTVIVSGLTGNQPINKKITFSFNKEPECGVIFIESQE